MVFFNIPKPQHQDEPDSCAPTCIKVVLDAQFKIQRGMSCIKKWVGYQQGCGSCSPYNTPIRLEPHLDALGLTSIEGRNANFDYLIDLLNRNILPIIFLKIKYLNESGIKKIRAYDGAEEWWHCIVICGIDEKNEHIFIYDPYLNYSGALTIHNCQVKINYALLTKYWKATNNRLYGLVRKKGSNKKEKDSTLTEFQEVMANDG